MSNEARYLEAIITLSYDDEDYAKAVSEAVSPDNVEVPLGLEVKTVKRGSKVITLIKCERSLETLIATIDDLLMSVQVAERVISVSN